MSQKSSRGLEASISAPRKTISTSFPPTPPAASETIPQSFPFAANPSLAVEPTTVTQRNTQLIPTAPSPSRASTSLSSGSSSFSQSKGAVAGVSVALILSLFVVLYIIARRIKRRQELSIYQRVIVERNPWITIRVAQTSSEVVNVCCKKKEFLKKDERSGNRSPAARVFLLTTLIIYVSLAAASTTGSICIRFHLSDEANILVKILGDGLRKTVPHRGAPGVSSHAEREASFGSLADISRVIVYDARGSGGSDPQPPYTLGGRP
ncbi:hypothetical protein C8R43DRAFT_964133 [Mycena crocata]|nr:hypothetical protein C8R43DRAFT_964117 [Mycena crocata]KAJ7099867.1 hypothetical protein C8R43DRAFT_964133 [Mycena crocata]